MGANFSRRKHARLSSGQHACRDLHAAHAVMVCALLLGCGVIGGCATPPAKGFGSSWQPANYFPDSPTEIPLNVAYTFYAAPMDGTLKAMLARWARDTQRKLTYEVAFDVTLFSPVTAIRTTNIQAAVSQLSAIYAAQRVLVTATDKTIVAEPAGSAAAGTTSVSPVNGTSPFTASRLPR